jgi:hypothetical protein
LGNDALDGGTGADVFVFAEGWGTDRILGFDVTLAGEVIWLAGVAAIAGFSDLTANHLTEVMGSAVITVGTDTITLTGVRMASLTADDFFFG